MYPLEGVHSGCQWKTGCGIGHKLYTEVDWCPRSTYYREFGQSVYIMGWTQGARTTGSRDEEVATPFCCGLNRSYISRDGYLNLVAAPFCYGLNMDKEIQEFQEKVGCHTLLLRVRQKTEMLRTELKVGCHTLLLRVERGIIRMLHANIKSRHTLLLRVEPKYGLGARQARHGCHTLLLRVEHIFGAIEFLNSEQSPHPSGYGLNNNTWGVLRVWHHVATPFYCGLD